MKQEYVIAISDRLDLNDDYEDMASADIITRNLMMDLIEADILELRASGIVSKEGMIHEIRVVSPATGVIETRYEMHAGFHIKELIKKRRDIVYKQLLATPEMRMRYKKKDMSTDSAKNVSDTVRAASEAIAKWYSYITSFICLYLYVGIA